MSELKVYNIGLSGDTIMANAILKNLTSHMANMLLMGGTDVSPPNKEIANLAIEYGACMLFGFTQPKSNTHTSDKVNSFFTRVSMLKGPGDVVKGSFKTS